MHKNIILHFLEVKNWSLFGLVVPFLLLFVALQGVYAQDAPIPINEKNLWKADSLRDRYDYSAALEVCQQMYEFDKDNSKVHLRLAEIYRLLGKLGESEHWYALATHDVVSDPTYLFYYAQALCTNKKYDQARYYFKQYSRQISEGYQRAQKKVKASNLPFFLSDSSTYVVERLPMNSLGADFSPTIFKDGLIYVTTRGKDLDINAIRKGGADTEFYFDLYFTKLRHKAFSEPVEFRHSLNSHLHEGPLAIFNNSSQMIFTRNYVSKNRKKDVKNYRHVGKLRLYSTQLNEDGGIDWEHPKILPFSDSDVSYGHPATDGKTLYFVSDMQGGAGATDIYSSTMKNGKWGNPVNMGPSINTKGYELFPYLGPDGMLYFSSDGLGGMGDLDVYRVDPQSEENPVNLGYPINTIYNDFGIALDPSGKSGYLSSNRTRGNHDDDIYRFYDLEDDSLYRIASKSHKTILVAMEHITANSYSNDIYSDDSPSNDSPSNDSPSNDSPSNDSPSNDSPSNDSPSDDSPSNDSPSNDSPSNDSPSNDSPSNDSPSNLLETPLTQGGSMEDKQIYSSPDNIETLVIGEGATTYVLQKDGDRLIAYNGDVPPPPSTIWKRIRSVYFTFDKYSISTSALKELDKLVSVMKTYNNTLLEIRAHTDSRGVTAYNQTLSVRRAEAVVLYLSASGINKGRIVSRPRGEEEPVNECDDVHPCSEAEHLLNRRVNFKLTIPQKTPK